MRALNGVYTITMAVQWAWKQYSFIKRNKAETCKFTRAYEGKHKIAIHQLQLSIFTLEILYYKTGCRVHNLNGGISA